MTWPSPKYLRTFQVAARTLNFTSASSELCLTASAVAQQMRKLEYQLGVTLFERHAQTLRLTAAGQQLLEHVDSVLLRLQKLGSHLGGRQRHPYIKLQLPPFFARELVLPRLWEFTAMHPEVEIHLSTPATALAQVGWDADVAVVVGTPGSAQGEATRLLPQAFVAACAPALAPQVRLGEAQQSRGLVLLAHGYRPDLWERWSAHAGLDGLHPRAVIRLDTMAGAADAAEHGAGVALLSAALVARRFAAGTLARASTVELSSGESYCLVSVRPEAARSPQAALVRWLTRLCRAVGDKGQATTEATGSKKVSLV